MKDFSDIEIVQIRKQIDEEVKKLPQCQNGWGPETKDFEAIKDQILSHIAYRIWEKRGKPQNHDTSIWFEAEETWNFVRYMW